jgi:hypothetical protein
MNLVTVTLGQLVDRALEKIQADAEVGRMIVRAAPLAAGATTLQVSDATLVNVTDRIEFGDELVYVTAKTDDTATATLTVVRGYASTVDQTHGANESGTINPQWTRKRVANHIRESFTFLDANGLQLVFTDSFVSPVTDPIDTQVMLLPVVAGARRVHSVRLGTFEVPNWVEGDQLDDDAYPSERVIRMPTFTKASTGPFTVVYELGYRWYNGTTLTTTPTEASTIQMLEGTEFLPALYAAWQMVSVREASRSQIDRSEEAANAWHDTGLTLVRLKQQEFYQALDAARRLQPRLLRRTYVPAPSYSGMFR